MNLTETPAANELATDRRIDLIGFVDELSEKFADPLRKSVKTRMEERSNDRATADCFAALLTAAGQIIKPDPDSLLRMYERGKISRKDYLSAVSVKLEPCRGFLGEKQIIEISEVKPSARQLRVNRIKGVEIKLVDAVREVSEAIASRGA